MRVAIIGAGITGLACAIELEKYGIRPVIFEKNHRIGSPFPYAPLLLDFIFRPIKRPLHTLKTQYNIKLKPISDIRFMRVQGPQAQFSTGGNLGYSLLQGQEIHSIESQMASHLKTSIQFETPVKPEDILKQYDYVVVATGNKEYAHQLGIWQNTYQSWVRGATILGRFNPQEIRFWFNKNYTKGGYAYMVPMGIERATLMLSVADTTQDKLAEFWQKFIDQEKLDPEIVLLWDVAFNTGEVFPHRVGNTFFVGNSGGFVTSWLGEGTFSSIMSGIEAARSIATGCPFEKRMKEITQIMERQARFRSLWDKFDNKGIDRAIRLMGSPLIQYPLYHTNLNFFKAIDHFNDRY
ncbi:FAD dependent oxidoreductase [Desulforamulus reducens MI-1]|uniref:FAD dependent oxidoreductase n=1 Tax=Desulforamulus reducens (strain ATCC BAA-1160 / DSM 100696 / MI-1) TaxID=349161 RepID=A4J3X6_DESRM|nr:NAD(P)/FAD-dependent oxidoreductase [Desulforamulus reducens]ABO49779.1 FAD dependent oxidoreductase [Desulforamulus reducens MI-1]